MVVAERIGLDGAVVVPAAIAQASGARPGDVVVFETVEPGRVEVRILGRLSLDQILERFRIDEPVDPEADRDSWHDQAMKDAADSFRV